jgi:hypothetical protein
MASTTHGIARAKVRRRRFLMLGVAMLAVLGTVLGISFTADTGTTSVSVTSGSGAGKLVYPVTQASGDTMPTGALNGQSLEHGTAVAADATTSSVRPTWAAAAGVPGTVTTAGDVSVIDATTTSAGGAANIQLTIYVTNLGALGGDYTSWAWPISVYKTINGGAAWTLVPNSSQFITHTLGFLSYTLPTGSGFYYDVTMETGGSFYTVATTSDSTHSLSPSFYFTAQPV